VNPDDFARAVTGRDDLGAWSDCLEEAGRPAEARALRAALRAGRAPYPVAFAEPTASLGDHFHGRNIAWGWFRRQPGSWPWNCAELPAATLHSLSGYVKPPHYEGRYYATCGLAWVAYLAARLAVWRGCAGVGKGVGR
jgi:hypothetical protein